jgi:hypothetical protein
LIIIPAPVPVGRRGFTFPSLVRLFLEDSAPVYSYENPCLFISQFACPNNVRLYIIAFPAAYSQGCVTVCLDVPAPAPPAGGQLVTVDELGLSRFRIVRMAAEVVVLVACIDESL